MRQPKNPTSDLVIYNIFLITLTVTYINVKYHADEIVGWAFSYPVALKSERTQNRVQSHVFIVFTLSIFLL